MSRPSTAAVDAALARAVLCRTLSIGLQAPTEAHLIQIAAREGCPAVATALRYLAGESDRTQDANIERVVGRLGATLVPDEETLAATFVRLFGHTARGLVCACETEYGPDNAFHQPQQLADISGYYVAFGLRAVAMSETRVDHIACELEFMDFLNRKEAVLLARSAPAESDDETLDMTRQAMRTFLRDHLGRFGRSFASRLMREDADGYLGVLGLVLLTFLEMECARLRVEAGPTDLVLRPETPDDAPVACGTPDELIQIQRHP